MDGWKDRWVDGWIDGGMVDGQPRHGVSGKEVASPQHQDVVTLIPLGMQRIDIWLSVPGVPS